MEPKGALLLGVLALTLAICASQKVSDYRLPQDFRSVSYNIKIAPDFSTFLFSGAVTFKFEPIVPTDTLILNVRHLNLNLSSVNILKHGDYVRIKDMVLDDQLERFIVRTEEPFHFDTTYDLSLSYTGVISDDGFGFYRSSYNKDGKMQHLGVTQLRPVHARRVFPCFDEPIYRAAFNIEITHDKDQHAISNMPIHSMVPVGPAKIKTVFEVTPRIPPFLVAFMVSDLAGIEKANFSGWAVPSKVEGIRWGTEVGPRLLTAMEEHIGLPYNLPKTDIVAQPRLIPVAMENVGLFNFREQFSLYFPGESKSLQKQDVARFLGHEVAHCWMGNPVTIAWWDFLWLSEVFAMHYEYEIPSLVFPPWKMDIQRWVDLHQSGLLDDSMPNSPLTTSVLTPAQISAKFAGLTYTKGPALLRMVIHTLTKPQWIKGFNKFIKDNYEKSVTPEILWNTLDSFGAYPTSLNEIMTNWTDISGYPEVEVSRDYFSGEIFLSQSTFTRDQPIPDTKTWWIPLSYTTRLESNFASTAPKLWIHGGASHSFKIPQVSSSNWIIFNIQATGFYRVNYDLDNWDSLIKQLHVDHSKIHELNRAQLVDDSFNLARGGRLQYSIPLRLGRYLRSERNFTPWNAALRVLGYLQEVLVNSDLAEYFRGYMKDILSGVYLDIGFEEDPDDSHLTRLNRELVTRWACQVGIADCVSKSARYVASLGPQSKGPMKVSVDVKDTALCTGVAYGKLVAWQIVLSLYGNAQPDFRDRYLNALACTRDYSLMNRFLTESIFELPESSWNSRFVAFSNRRTNAESLLRILDDNRTEITNAYGTGNFTKYAVEAAKYIATRGELEMLAKLQQGGVAGLEAAVTGATGRVAWIERNEPVLREYFTKPKKEEPLIFSK